MKQRSTYFDAIKFSLIILVIIGHLIAKYISNPINNTIYNFIYLFHMPLFIFISGYFHKKFDWQSSKKSIFRIVEIYILLQIIWFFIWGKFDLYHLLKPSWTLWYLLSIIWWRILANLTVPYINKRILIPLSFIVATAWGFLEFDGEIFSVNRTIAFFPFYLLGVYCTEDVIQKIRKINILIPIVIILIALVYTQLPLIKNFENFQQLLWGSKSYSELSNNITNVLSLKFANTIIAIFLSLAFIRLIPDTKILYTNGKDTLFYYVYHTFFIKAINLVLGKLYPDFENTFGLLLISIALVVILSYANKIKFFHRILTPYTSFIKHEK